MDNDSLQRSKRQRKEAQTKEAIHKQCTDLRAKPTKRPKRRQATGGNDTENPIPDIVMDSNGSGYIWGTIKNVIVIIYIYKCTSNSCSHILFSRAHLNKLLANQCSKVP